MDRLQYPVVRITKCAECQHLIRFEVKERYECHTKGKTIKDIEVVQHWCPLPKVDDLKKELV